MKVVNNILLLIGIVFAIFGFYITANYYDFQNDKYTFIKQETFYESTEKKKNDISVVDEKTTFPMISFSTVFNTNYHFYRVVGYFFVFGFIFGMCLMILILTKANKASFYDTFKDNDNYLLFINCTLIIAFLSIFVQVMVYNNSYLNKNDMARRIVREKNAITLIASE